MIRGARRWGSVLVAVAVAGGLAAGGRGLWVAWRQGRTLAEVRELVQGRRYGAAVRTLSAALARDPDSDEFAFLLGLCEGQRGRMDQAVEAWNRIPPGSRFAPQALLCRAKVLAELGQFAEIEELLTRALRDPRIDGSDLRRYLIQLYAREGRLEEARRLIEALWDGLNRAGRGDAAQAVELVRLHRTLGEERGPAAEIRDDLDDVAHRAPEDDRIWLGKANWAIRRGGFDEAAHWLDACLRRRPRDVPVWRARLDWALGAGRVSEVWEALGHLPVDSASPARVHRLAAWLAARRGDTASERHALERLLAESPREAAAIDRLAELATREGQPARATELRREQEELHRLDRRYLELLRRNQPVRHAVKRARLAEQLGLWFEAKVFSKLAISTGSAGAGRRAAPARLERRQATVAAGPGTTLAEALASERDAATDASGTQPASSADSDASASPPPGLGP
jgi:thioredoxin-like negative regulator of GroEL